MNITANMIRTLQLKGTDHAALIERHDGTPLVVIDLRAHQDEHGDTEPVLRHPAKAWADALVALARETWEGHTTPKIAELRAAAADLATDELAEDTAREAVVTTPRVRPALAVVPRQRGRHAAPLSEAQREAETHALCALLDELEEAGLTRAA